MTTDNALDYQSVMQAVSQWSARDRFRLVQAVLATLEPPARLEPSERQSTYERALGLLATDGPPPSDEDVKRIVEEELLKKYG